jgi:hypothetical protein
MSDSEIENTLRRIASDFAVLAELLAAERSGGPVGDGWVPQKGSKLGRNNHIEAVRRLQSAGVTDRAVTRGKLHLLRKDAYDEELVRAGRKPMPPRKPMRTVKASEESKGDDLEARFRRRLGAR